LRTKYLHTAADPELFKQKLLVWSQQFKEVICLDSNNYQQNYSSFEAVIAVDAVNSIQSDYNKAFKTLKHYQSHCKDWVFGYLTYDLKNDVESLESNNFDGLQFPELYFFQPKKIFLFRENEVVLLYLDAYREDIENDIKKIEQVILKPVGLSEDTIKIKLRIHKDEYFEKVNNILEHIHRGDIYETNFCQEFSTENTVINPLETYFKLNAISRSPFATYFKLNDLYLLSSSPERYLKKQDLTIVAQPIKGTAKRSLDLQEDEVLKSALFHDEKERSENIMILDLMRNDLSKTAIKGSVRVEELCKVYTFNQVHQMISTVTSQIDKNMHPVDVIKSTFPMGSMTGAPKISAMKIIEELEETKRGLYSGAVGYFSPEGDFDFNVVIRSILYNGTNKYVSYSVGGAITAKSDPFKEYEECLVKAKAMREVLEN